MTVNVEGKNIFTKEMARVFQTEVIECPDCGFEFASKHELDETKECYNCPSCNEDNLTVENEKLKKQLEAKLTFISNGKEEELYALQEENIALKDISNVVVYDNGVVEINYADKQSMLINDVIYSDAFLSGWDEEDCGIKR